MGVLAWEQPEAYSTANVSPRKQDGGEGGAPRPERSPLPEAVAIQRAQQGDAEAFERLGRGLAVALDDFRNGGGRVEAVRVGVVAERLNFPELLLPLQELVVGLEPQWRVQSLLAPAGGVVALGAW